MTLTSENAQFLMALIPSCVIRYKKSIYYAELGIKIYQIPPAALYICTKVVMLM